MLGSDTIEKIVKSFRQCLQLCSGKERNKITMEFRKGDVTLLSIPQEKNIFNSKRYNVNPIFFLSLQMLTFFPSVLFYNCQRWQNLFFFAISLIMLISPSHSPFLWWIIIIPLAFNFLIYMLKEYLLDFQRSRTDALINQQKTTRGLRAQGNLEEKVFWENLQIGDIIYLKKGDIVPADMILLDSGQVREREAICMIDTKYTDGKSTLTKKKSSYLTQLIVTRTRQKNNYKEYRKMLTGKLEYEAPNGNTLRFQAWLKLKKDPKTEQLGIENFIPKGSKIRQTSWLFGMVVYAGSQCRMMNCSKYSTKKSEQYAQIGNFLSVINIALALFLAAVSVIVSVSRSDELEFMNYDDQLFDGSKIFNLFVLYSSFLPLNLYLIQDLIHMFLKYKIEKEMIAISKSQYIKVNDSSSVADLGHVDYMLIDKTGTLTTSYQKIECLIFGENCYSIKHDSLFKQLEENGNQIPQTYKLENKNGRDTEIDYLIAFEDDDNQIDNARYQGLAQLKEQKIPKQNYELFRMLKVNIRNSRSKQTTKLTVFQKHQQQAQLVKDILTQEGTNQDFLAMKKMYNDPIKNYKTSKNMNSLIYDTFMKCVLLCHEARPVFFASKTCYESFSKTEEVTLEFAQLCGYYWKGFAKSDSPDEYLCQIRDETVKYKILGLNVFTYPRNLNSVVIQAPTFSDIIVHDDYSAVKQLSGMGSKENSLLICKGDYDAMQNLIDMNQKEREELENVISYYQKKGIRMIIYGTKELSESDTEVYSRTFNNLKSQLTSQDDELEKLAISYETKLTLIGIMGFKEELKPDAYDFIQSVKQSNINIWVLSGDQEASTLSCTQSIGVSDNAKMKLIRIQESNKEEIFMEMNNGLSQIQSELQHDNEKNQEAKIIHSSTTLFKGESYNKMGTFSLSINGVSLKTIEKDNELASHFRFLSSICKCVIGYNLTPQQKEYLCQIIKYHFPDNPTVLAVGDGFNDALMMQQADISIELLNQGKKQNFEFTPQINAGDILISELSQIKELMQNQSKIQSERTSYIIYEMFYHSILLGMTLFFFNWFCSFTSSSLFDSIFVFGSMMVFNVPNLLMSGLFLETSKKDVNQQFPSLYIDGQIRKRHFFVEFIMKSFLQGLIQASGVYYSTIYIVQSGENDEGTSTDLHLQATLIAYTYLIYTTFKLFTINITNQNMLIIPSQIITLGLIAIFISIQMATFDYKIYTVQIFTRFTLIMNLIYNLIICFYTSYLLNVIRLIILPTAYEQFSHQNKGGVEWESFSNAEIITQCVTHVIDISRLVKSVFVSVDRISPYIQEMLNPGDTQVTEMKLSLVSLEMKELVLEKKFKSAKLQTSINHYRLFTILLCLYFGAYFLTDQLIVSSDDFTFYQYLIIIGIILMVLLFTFTSYMQSTYYTASHLIIAAFIGLKIASDWISDDINIALSAQLVALLTTIHTTNMKVIPIVFYNIIYFLQFSARIIILAIINSDQTIEGPYTKARVSIFSVSAIIILSLCIVIMLLQLFYKTIKQRRNDFLARYQIELDNNTSQDILSILVPKFVQQSIQTGIYEMEQAQEDVSILFCYICDFDNIMKEEGKNVVMMLDSLFRVYDNLCLQHGVQKIETVGYTYMAATNIKQCEAGISTHILKTQKTMRLINLAYDMLNQVVGRKYGKGNQLEIKIGIHVGSVIAGVIGHHKPQFSLIGDPVNQTSRVASTGDNGGITLSEIAYKESRRWIKYYSKKKKWAKGLGDIFTYQVFAEKPLNYQIPEVQLQFINAFKKIKETEDFKNQLKQAKTNKKSFLKQLKQRYQLEIQKEEEEKKLMLSSRGPQNKKIQVQQNLQNNPSAQLSPQNPVENHQFLENQQNKEQQTNNANNQQVDEVQEMLSEEDDLFKEDDEKVINESNVQLIKPNILLTVTSDQDKTLHHFNNIIKEKNQKEGKYILIALWMTYLIITLLLIIVRKLFEEGMLIFFIRIIFLILLLPLILLLDKAYKQITIKFTYFFILLYGSYSTLIQSYFTDNESIASISILELLYLLIIASHLKIFNFIQMLLFMICIFAGFLGFYITNSFLSHYFLFYLIASILLILVGSYFSLSENITIFNNLQINEEKKIRQLKLVSQLLPTHAFLKMRNSSIYNKQALIDEFYDVTLLFADIKGFTEYSHHCGSPKEVVTMLRNLFTEFDKSCQKFNVYKVYTIGDCYVVMGFTNSAKRDPVQEAINTINMGFEMVQIIMDVRKKINFDKMNMRIGIHTGYVIGGIIGTDIVRYDLYGKDVSIANKMESGGVEGKVMVSEDTKKMVEKKGKGKIPFLFNENGIVDVPKFGMEIKAYLVEKNNNYKGSPIKKQ